MKVSYSRLRAKLSFASKQLTLVVGLLVLPITVCLEKATSAPKPKTPLKAPEQPIPGPDPRTERLKRFLTKLHCPISNLAPDFISAADENELDWRLLPSISVIESGGGKAYRNNNIFGWGNGQYLFSTLKSGINEVAFKLGRSPLYRNHNTVAKLHIYNPEHDEYASNVLAVMNRISPVVRLKAVSPAQARLSLATD